MATIVTLGSATQDIFLLHPNDMSIKRYVVDRAVCIDEGTKNEIDSVHYGIGGGAVNTAVALHRLGHQVAPFCMLCNDEAGKFILHELQAQGISTQGITVHEHYATGISCIITCDTCDSALLVYRGANSYVGEKFATGMRSFNSMGTNPFWYCGPVSGDAAVALGAFLATIRPHVASIAVNPSAFQLGIGYPDFQTVLPHVDIMMCNTREARMLAVHIESQDVGTVVFHNHYEDDQLPRLIRSFFGTLTLVHFAEHVMQQGPRIVVITDGAHGVYVVNASHVYFHPAFSVNILNTVGAGDAFSATFFGYLIEGETIMSALARAMLNSAAVIHNLDATSGLLSTEELQKRYEHQGVGEIQEFSYEVLH